MSYTLIAYRPNSSVRACARGCCGYNSYDSSHSVERGLTEPELIDKVAKYHLEDEDYEGNANYELTYFSDSVMTEDDEIAWLDRIADHVHYRLAQLKQDARVAAEQKAQEDAAAEQKAAEEARLQAEKDLLEYERSELLRLQEKFKT